MAGDLEQITLNGLAFDQTSVRAKIGNVRLASMLKDITFGDKMTPTAIRGTHPVKYATGLGIYEADDTTLTIQQEGWEPLQAELLRLSGAAACITVVQFDVTINFVAFGARPQEILLRQCRVKSRGFGGKNNADGLVRAIGIDVTEILENGIRLAPASL